MYLPTAGSTLTHWRYKTTISYRYACDLRKGVDQYLQVCAIVVLIRLFWNRNLKYAATLNIDIMVYLSIDLTYCVSCNNQSKRYTHMWLLRFMFVFQPHKWYQCFVSNFYIPLRTRVIYNVINEHVIACIFTNKWLLNLLWTVFIALSLFIVYCIQRFTPIELQSRPNKASVLFTFRKWDVS